jgi:hypothetical protein
MIVLLVVVVVVVVVVVKAEENRVQLVEPINKIHIISFGDVSSPNRLPPR